MRSFGFLNRAARKVAATAAVMGLLAVADVVRGQGFPGLPPGFGEALQPDVASRDLRFFVEDLQLDDGQKAIMESLFADYETAFKAGADKVRQSIGSLDPSGEVQDSTRNERTASIYRELEGLVEKANEEEPAESPEERAARVKQLTARIDQLKMQLKELNPDPPRGDELQKAVQRIGENFQTWQADKIRLREQFVANVLAVLKDDQKERWPPLSRRITREHTLNKGRLSGESIDLFGVVKEMNFTPAVHELIQPVMAEYDVRLDAALQARNGEMDKSQQQLMQAMRIKDISTITAITDSMMKARIAVRNVNDDFAVLIAAKLPAEQAAAFSTLVKSRAYPRVYRPTQTQRLFKAAEELDGLDSKTRTSIKEIEQAYLLELGPVSDEVREVVRTNEALDQVNRAALQVGSGPRPTGRSADPIGQAFQRRNQMAQPYVDRLKALLTEEQWNRLPAGQQSSDRPPEQP